MEAQTEALVIDCAAISPWTETNLEALSEWKDFQLNNSGVNSAGEKESFYEFIESIKVCAIK